MSLESAIENLDFHFMSLLDYGDAIRLNRLNPMSEYEDDFRFTQANPEHPLNHIIVNGITIRAKERDKWLCLWYVIPNDLQWGCSICRERV